MTNVLYLHNSALISGGERSLLQLWKGLDRSRFQPFVILPGEGPFFDAARQAGVEVFVMAMPSIRPGNIFLIKQMVVKLQNLCRERKIALIHSYSPRNNILASWTGRSLKIPVIWHERNLIYGKERDTSRLCLPLADALICNSQAVARRFMFRGQIPSKVRVIHNGVDTKFFVPAIDRVGPKTALGLQGKKVVGLFANLEERKGISTFLSILHILCGGRQDIVALVVGGTYGSDDGRIARLRDDIRDHGLGEQVILTGFQSDVRPYLAACDVVCNVTEKEACSRSILEAMSAGVPVVAFCDGGNPELIAEKETGELVPAGDVVIFASRVRMLLDDELMHRRLGEKARQRAVDRFEAARNSMATQALYQELIGRRP